MSEWLVGEKRGQVTIFIIIAVLVVALGVSIYFIYPKIKGGGEVDTKNPSFEFVSKKYIKAIISELGNLSYDKFLRKVKNKTYS